MSSNMIEAVVEKGNTVQMIAEIPDGVGLDGRPKIKFEPRSFGPGETVKVNAVEAARLRKLGVLVDPDNPKTIPAVVYDGSPESVGFSRQTNVGRA